MRTGHLWLIGREGNSMLASHCHTSMKWMNAPDWMPRVTNRVWRAMHLDPATTLHDVRWGEQYTTENTDEFIWLFQISGAAPASHFVDGYAGAISERQPSMYFRLGGGTLKGIGKPGVGLEPCLRRSRETACGHRPCHGSSTSPEETDRRWSQVTSQWPIVHARLHGITRDQFMARHRANHLNVAYVPARSRQINRWQPRRS